MGIKCYVKNKFLPLLIALLVFVAVLVVTIIFEVLRNALGIDWESSWWVLGGWFLVILGTAKGLGSIVTINLKTSYKRNFG